MKNQLDTGSESVVIRGDLSKMSRSQLQAIENKINAELLKAAPGNSQRLRDVLRRVQSAIKTAPNH